MDSPPKIQDIVIIHLNFNIVPYGKNKKKNSF